MRHKARPRTLLFGTGLAFPADLKQTESAQRWNHPPLSSFSTIALQCRKEGGRERKEKEGRREKNPTYLQALSLSISCEHIALNQNSLVSAPLPGCLYPHLSGILNLAKQKFPPHTLA